jgi:excisionase family DNA binding protein
MPRPKIIKFPSQNILAPLTQDLVEPFITVAQLAERLHVKPSTIYEWTRRRETNPIPHIPISRKVVLFRWSDVVRWVEGKAA